MGSEETRTGGSESGSNDAGNVVRIPRDWYGPREELVPFGPQVSEDPPEPLDANSFWGEGASPVHDAVAPPDEPTDDGATELPAHVPDRFRLRGGARTAALVASLAVGAVVVGVLTSLGGASRPQHPGQAIAAVTAGAGAAADEPRAVANRRATVSSKVVTRHRVKAGAEGRQVSVSHGQATSGPVTPTQVVYHASYPTSSTSGYRSPASGSATQTPGAGSTASTSSTSQSSPTAFGANGALGPMSSPDG